MPKTTPTAPDLSEATANYLAEITRIRRQGETGELTYRSALESLLRTHLQARMPGCEVVHEPEKQKCGAPDFAVKRSGIAVGFVETKKIGANLDKEESGKSGEQVARYRAALPNFILSDYLEFRLYADGKPGPIAVAKIADSDLGKTLNGADKLAKLLAQFADAGATQSGESPSAARLAQIMAGKTRLLRDLVEKTAADPNSDLTGIHEGLRENLIPDLTSSDFADIYAQTAVYGYFAARLESEKPGASKFSRLKAGELLPQTTPFLRRFFNTFAGADMDPRISWMADNIAEMFSVVSLDNVVRAFNQGGGKADDPFLHFYETFLREYDHAKRRARGVYFTPRPVVDFIVRAVDDSLVNEFRIQDGLANASKTQHAGEEMHTVQILDPAAGTGTFLARVVEIIRARIQKNAGKNGWKSYVPKHLLPRLHGFEILMSAYAMCHLKMALTMGDSVVDTLNNALGEKSPRVSVFLTNALEMSKHDIGNLPFLRWLREEALSADRVKTETPVMVVVGNPPYNVSSQNGGEWISKKMADYKEGLGKERNIRPLNDDYIKFIRYAEHFVEENGCGIVAMITNNSFYDGIIHRQMRKHLLGTFDAVRILNLRGNANIGDLDSNNNPDQNVFNIRQGVGIFIMTKTGEKKKGNLARVQYAELQGRRKMKYEFLSGKSLSEVEWRELSPAAPNYFFTPKNFGAEDEYRAGFPVNELFVVGGSGVKTSCDKLSVHFHRSALESVLDDFRNLSARELQVRYPHQKETSAWTFQRAKDGLENIPFWPVEICHRPFDIRHSISAKSSGGFIGRPRYQKMRHLMTEGNVALLTTRTIPAKHDFTHAYVSRRIADVHSSGGQTYVFPLWILEGEVGKEGAHFRANFSEEAAKKFAERMGMAYSEDEKGKKADIVTPESLFDYIYAILHRPSYRSRFAEFLRIDYPRIPPAANKAEFRRMSDLGRQLRELHLLESTRHKTPRILFSGEGKNVVGKIRFAADANGIRGRVFINATLHFANVPPAAWEYCIGGYYPARQWLKDREGRTLSYDEQEHYRRMLAALAQTAALVEKLDEE